MKVGRNVSHLEFTLTREEREAFSSPFIRISIDPDSKTEWAVLSGSEESGRLISTNERSASHPYRVAHKDKTIPVFGTEVVAARRSHNVIVVERPTMRVPHKPKPRKFVPRVVKANRGRGRQVAAEMAAHAMHFSPQSAEGKELRELIEAVQAVNRFMTNYSQSCEVELEDNKIKVLLVIK